MGKNERAAMRSCSVRLSRSQRIAIAVLAGLFVVYSLTPYDSRARSFVRFQHNVVEDYFQAHFPADSWLFQKQRYPVDPDHDVGIVVKTGYGTRHRVPHALQAQSNQSFFADTIVTQDFPVMKEQRNYTLANGKKVPVIDIIGWNVQRGALNGSLQSERIGKYKNLAAAVEAEEWVLSDLVGKQIGWELDAMKFLPSLEYAWKTMPKKKWYLMLDDDTYMIKSSMSLLLGHLNFGQPQLLGNPVGDYKGRFPHGGSSVVISGATLARLFDGHPKVLAEGHHESPTAVYGDKLLSTTLMKIGIYLDETYRRMFNGENPEMTRMWVDRFCMPLVSFHGLGDGEAMERAGTTFANMTDPVFWRSMRKIYGAPDWESYIDKPIRENVEYVGRLDESSTTVENIGSPEECLQICDRRFAECLAWSYDPPRRLCHTAPWAIVGDHSEGRFSGVNGRLAQNLERACHST